MNQNQLAHSLWKEHILSNHKFNLCLVDATCGNGHDSLFLSSFEDIQLHCIDIQEQAIEQTKKRLKIKKKNIHFYLRSHEDLSFIDKPIDLITYNLGYLPGSNKKIITTPETTLKSLKSAISKLSPIGMISIMVYKGHTGAGAEQTAIKDFIQNLDSNFHVNLNINHLKPTSPDIFIITRLNMKISL